jgi:hypothetical protein
MRSFSHFFHLRAALWNLSFLGLIAVLLVYILVCQRFIFVLRVLASFL